MKGQTVHLTGSFSGVDETGVLFDCEALGYDMTGAIFWVVGSMTAGDISLEHAVSASDPFQDPGGMAPVTVAGTDHGPVAHYCKHIRINTSATFTTASSATWHLFIPNRLSPWPGK